MDRRLPYKYRFSHDLCVDMLYELTDILDKGQESGFYNVSLDIEEEAAKNIRIFPSLSRYNLFEWLENNGFNETVKEMTFISLVKGILFDLINFVYEALSCSERGKISITYALLRKPLRENLHYLEWILSDPKKFVDDFLSKEATEFNLSHVGDKKQVEPVLEKVFARLPEIRVYDLNLIYDLRFNKDYDAGFERHWNQAIHLVTTKKKLATSPRNLNFIFAEETIDDLHKFWHHIYGWLPCLLMYTVDIAYSLMFIAARDLLDEENFSIPGYKADYVRRLIGFLFHIHEKQRFSIREKEFPDLGFSCIHCGFAFPANPAIYYNFFERQKSTCLNCKKEVELLDLDIISFNQETTRDKNCEKSPQ